MTEITKEYGCRDSSWNSARNTKIPATTATTEAIYKQSTTVSQNKLFLQYAQSPISPKTDSGSLWQSLSGIISRDTERVAQQEFVLKQRTQEEEKRFAVMTATTEAIYGQITKIRRNFYKAAAPRPWPMKDTWFLHRNRCSFFTRSPKDMLKVLICTALMFDVTTQCGCTESTWNNARSKTTLATIEAI